MKQMWNANNLKRHETSAKAKTVRCSHKEYLDTDVMCCPRGSSSVQPSLPLSPTLSM
jgi:hypothetical protein